METPDEHDSTKVDLSIESSMHVFGYNRIKELQKKALALLLEGQNFF